MKQNKSHTVQLSSQELQLIEALKDYPEMLEQFTATTREFNEEVNSGMDAYEAEKRVTKSIQEIGRTMLLEWADKSQKVAVSEATESSQIIKNGKKNSTGIAPSEKFPSKPK